MIEFQMPQPFEGVQFCDELEAAGVSINRDSSPFLDGAGRFWLDIDEADTATAQALLDAHIPLPPAEPTTAQKLEAAGVSLDDLREALGLA